MLLEEKETIALVKAALYESGQLSQLVHWVNVNVNADR